MDNVEKILNSIDIVQVISEHIQLKKVGTNFKGLCPFHSEKTPSFIVNPQKGIFKCFGCGAGGNLITFHMKLNNTSFSETLNLLAQKYKIELEVKKKFKKEISSSKVDILKETATFFKTNLFDKKGQSGLEYLLKERKFTKEFIYEYNLGFSLNEWDALLKHLIEKEYKKEDLLSLGLIKENGDKVYDTFRNRIMFPITDAKGQVVGFGGRAIDNAMPKYLNSSESDLFHKSKILYGLLPLEIRKKEYTLLMEGYMDVLAAHSYGFKNAIASLGTSFTEEQASLLNKYTKNVLICFDKDSAGLKATERAIVILKKFSFNIKVLDLKTYKDPDDFLKNEGAEKFKELIKSSTESFDFLYSTYSKNLDLNIATDKKKLVIRFIDFFSSLNNLELEIYLDKLSILIRINKNVLKSYLLSNKHKPFIQKNSAEEKKEKKIELTNLEKETIIAILKFPKIQGDLEELYRNSPNTEMFSYIVNSLKEKNFEERKEYISEMDLDILIKESERDINIQDFLVELVYSWKKRIRSENLFSIEEKLLYADSEQKMNLIKEYYNTKKEKEES